MNKSEVCLNVLMLNVTSGTFLSNNLDLLEYLQAKW